MKVNVFIKTFKEWFLSLVILAVLFVFCGIPFIIVYFTCCIWWLLLYFLWIPLIVSIYESFLKELCKRFVRFSDEAREP